MRIKDVLKLVEKYLVEEGVDDARLKARILLSNTISKPKEYLITHDDEDIKDATISKVFEKVMRIKEGVPIQYVTNHQEFYGLDFYVNENVLIPQPDTEILVEEAIGLISTCLKDRLISENSTQIKVLDLCTGSGIIAISLKKKFGDGILMFGSDISREALGIAKRNAKANSTSVNYFESNLFENIEEKEFDFIISNPPYIRTNDIETLSKEVQKEPHIALDGGEDGLDFYRKIVAESKDYLKDCGYLLLEIGYDQKESVVDILNKNGYTDVYSKKDYAGNDRIVIGKKG